MTTITLNIGLEQNIEGLERLNRFFVEHLTRSILGYSINLGTRWGTRVEDSNTEPTLIIQFDTPAHVRRVIPYIRTIANATNQDAISLSSSDGDYLVYADRPTRDWGSFNPMYFIGY